MSTNSLRNAALGGSLLVVIGLGLDVHVKMPGLVWAQANSTHYDTTYHVLPSIASTTPTDVTMRNVDFHAAEGVVLRIHSLRGQMRGKRGIVDFDDVTSYETDVSSAEVGMTGDDLTNLLNRHVFAYPGAPLSGLHVEITPDGVRQSGILHKGVNIPFDMTSSVSVTPDGRIQLSPTKVKIFGVNGMVLMRALGLSMEKMMDLSKAKGVTVKGNDLFLEPLVILPPPVIRGKLTSARIAGNQLVQTLGTPPDSAPTQTIDPSATNFMLYRGGTLHFTKLYMTDTELLVVDEDQTTPFDFDNPNYTKQLIAGHSRTLPTLGLEVWMPDASAVKTTVASRGRR